MSNPIAVRYVVSIYCLTCAKQLKRDDVPQSEVKSVYDGAGLTCDNCDADIRERATVQP